MLIISPLTDFSSIKCPPFGQISSELVLFHLNASNWIEQSDFSANVKFESAGWNFALHFPSIFIRSNWRVFCHFDRTFTTVKCAQFSSQVRSASAEEVSSMMWRSITLSEHRVQINLHSHWSVQSDAYFMQFSSFCFCIHHMDQRNKDNDSFLDWIFNGQLDIQRNDFHQVYRSKLRVKNLIFHI